MKELTCENCGKIFKTKAKKDDFVVENVINIT